MYADVRIKELATDTTAPTITVRNVPDGLVLLQGTPFTADYACADEQDLIDCTATAIDTGTPGRFTFKVTATRRRRQRAGRHPRLLGRRLHHRDRLGRRDGAGDARAHPRDAGVVRRLHPGRREGLHGLHDGDGRQHRRRRDADGHRSQHGQQRPARERRVRAAAAAAGRGIDRCPRRSRRGATPRPTSPSRSRSPRRSAWPTPLRTGPYSKTLTFTLSTTTP